MAQTQQSPAQNSPYQSDFLLLRQAILFYLEGVGKGTRTSDMHLLREGVGRTEWKAITRDRRIWAMGKAAGDAVPFDDATELAGRSWKELDPELRRVLSEHVLDWIRK